MKRADISRFSSVDLKNYARRGEDRMPEGLIDDSDTRNKRSEMNDFTQ